MRAYLRAHVRTDQCARNARAPDSHTSRAPLSLLARLARAPVFVRACDKYIRVRNFNWKYFIYF